jgi:hypothetical protein
MKHTPQKLIATINNQSIIKLHFEIKHKTRTVSILKVCSQILFCMVTLKGPPQEITDSRTHNAVHDRFVIL